MVGIHRNPVYLLKYMKLLKLNSFINIGTSISWNIKTNELHFFCDSGRIIRPIFNLKSKKGKKYNELISGDIEYIKNWNNAIYGYMLEVNEDINFNTSVYFKDELDKLKSEKGEDLLEFLEEKSAVIEYIDSTESEECFNSKRYEHI